MQNKNSLCSILLQNYEQHRSTHTCLKSMLGPGILQFSSPFVLIVEQELMSPVVGWCMVGNLVWEGEAGGL